MSIQTTESRRRDVGWWVSIIAISTLAALQVGVIVHSAATGQATQMAQKRPAGK